MNYPVYETLYDWQKLFVDNTPSQYFEQTFGTDRVKEALGTMYGKTIEGAERIGFFLKMGIGKTKISVAKAEKMNADCIFAVSLKSKVVSGEVEGEFGDELKLAGYKVFYAHRAMDEDGHISIPSIDTKGKFKEFEQAVENKEKVAYIFNHEHIITKKGYQRLVYLASVYSNIAWIIDEAHKISNRSSNVSKKIEQMLNRPVTPDVKVGIRELNRRLKEAEEKGNEKEITYVNRLLTMNRSNIFKDNIKGFYLLTGTPNASGYESFYWLLTLLGHSWETIIGTYNNDTGEIEESKLTAFKSFFNDFCVEDTFMKKFNPYGSAIKGYKNEERLLDIVQQYSFFAKTHNYYEGMPTRMFETIVVPKHESYTMMTDPSDTNEHYRVLGGFIADMPALLAMRARQLASGFMGSAHESDYFHTYKVDALTELITDKPDNYIVFYNYTPELYMIMSAAETAGYNIDIWNGNEKTLDNYRRAKDGQKNMLIANIASGSAAMNFQKYANVVFYALPDLYMDYDQAIARVERIGQKRKEVNVYVMYMKGTIEEKVWKKLKIGEDYTNKMYERDIIWRDI